MVLGGMLIPIELFPEYMQPYLKALPFASIVYGPARMFVDPDPAQLTVLLGNQLMGIFVFSIFVYAVYKIAAGRIFANGG